MLQTNVHMTLRQAAELIGIYFTSVNDDLSSSDPNTFNNVALLHIGVIQDEFEGIFSQDQIFLVPSLVQKAVATAQAKVSKIHDAHGKVRYLKSCYSMLQPHFKYRWSLEKDGVICTGCDAGGVADFTLISDSTVRITFHNADAFFNHLIQRLGAKGYFMDQEMALEPSMVKAYSDLFLEHSFDILGINRPPMVSTDDKSGVAACAIHELKNLIKEVSWDKMIQLVADKAYQEKDFHRVVNVASSVFGYSERRIIMGIEEKGSKAA